MIKKIKGKAYWARILGAPIKSANPEEREWSMDLALDPEGIKQMKDWGLGKRLKTRGDDRGVFLTFRRREFKKGTTTPNKPISVVDADGKEWDRTALIGNGSLVEVTFNLFEVPASHWLPVHNKDAILEVKVLEHIPYVKKEAGADSWKDAF